jgi:dihydrofolate reductase
MAQLIYSAISSVDGYIEDKTGSFDWAAPDEEVHGFINDLERQVGTYLLGRKTYEIMEVWDTDPGFAEQSPVTKDFAEVWQSVDKIVFSKTLQSVANPKTRLEHDFDAGSIQRLKDTSSNDLSIGGPNLAAHAFRAGLIDECHLFLVPVVVGGGKQALPDNTHLELMLTDERRFTNGTVFLRYRIQSKAGQ